MPTGTGTKQALGAVLLRAWERRGWLARLLMPLSLVYYAVWLLRRALYRLGLLTSQRVDCVVLVVGNVVAGGAGKTPTTMAIVQHLKARGIATGVVSRGYGRSSRAICEVEVSDDAAVVGDEPLMMARATGVPVFVAASRHAGATALLQAHPATQVIVCDDGLQHYALRRDLEVCVLDDRGLGNGWLLPSGPLREPWPRRALACAGQSDVRLLVLHTGAAPAFAGYRAHRHLAPFALTHDGQRIALAGLQGPLLALAGIAKPHEFFAALRATGLVLNHTLALPDHCDFSGFDLAAVRQHQVLCTEKDAVKLWKYLPTALAVPLQQTLEPAFVGALDTLLDSALHTPLSSSHGHQTT